MRASVAGAMKKSRSSASRSAIITLLLPSRRKIDSFAVEKLIHDQKMPNGFVKDKAAFAIKQNFITIGRMEFHGQDQRLPAKFQRSSSCGRFAYSWLRSSGDDRVAEDLTVGLS